MHPSVIRARARLRIVGLALIVALGLATACGSDDDRGTEQPDIVSGADAPDPQELLTRIRTAVESELRPEGDTRRDIDRRPADVLAFFGIDEGQRVLELMAGPGYYTEILSSIVGPGGRVYVQNNYFVGSRFVDPALSDRIDKLREAGLDNIERIDSELDEMELPENLDAAVFVRFYHDLFWQPTPDGDLNDRPEMLRRVFESLKPGGVFGIVDHHAEAGSGERDAIDPREGLHRIDVELVVAEVLAAGFELDAESDVLSHPEDTRDWNIFSDDAARRDRTDRFVLRFVKP